MHAIGQNDDIDPYSIFTEPLQTRDPSGDTYSDFPAYQASQAQEIEAQCLQIIADSSVPEACQNPLCYAANPSACDAAVAEQEQQAAGQQRSTMITYVAVGAAALVVGYLVLR
jgi:hypothetical protein